jgi:hypothetical protein
MTNKKYVIAAAIALVALVAGAAFLGGRAAAPKMDEVELKAKIEEATRAFYADRLGSVTILMPDTLRPVTLAEGVAEFEAAPGSASKVSVRFASEVDVEVVQVPRADGTVRVDVLAVFDVSYGGSGTFRYVALFEDTGTALEMKSIALVGDRVLIDGISVKPLNGIDGEEYLATVDFRARNAEEPMAAEPTVAAKKLFVIENGAFNLAKTDSALAEQGKN